MEPTNSHIVIYNGNGICQDSVHDLIASFEEHLDHPRITCAETLNNEQLDNRFSLLVIPPGNPASILKGLAPVSQAIQEYVKTNALLAIGNGTIPFSQSFYLHDNTNGHEISSIPLQLVDIFKGSVVSPGRWEHENPFSIFNEEAVRVQWKLKEQDQSLELKMYHYSDPCFFDVHSPDVEVVATFSDSVPSFTLKDEAEGPDPKFDPALHAAVIEYTNPLTKAKAVLCGGCRPEMIPEADNSEYSIKEERQYHKKIMKDLTLYETERRKCMRDIFMRLGLPLKRQEEAACIFNKNALFLN